MSHFKWIAGLILFFLFFVSTPSYSDSSLPIYSVPLGGAPADIAINPYSNTAVIAINNAVSIVNIASQSVTSQIPFNNPGKIAFDTGLNRAFIINSPDNSISVLDMETLTITADIPVGQKIQDIAVNSQTHTAVILTDAGNGTGSLVLMDIPTQKS